MHAPGGTGDGAGKSQRWAHGVKKEPPRTGR